MQTESWLESFNGRIEAAKYDGLEHLGLEDAQERYAQDVPELIQEVRFWMGLAVRLAQALAKEARHE